MNQTVTSTWPHSTAPDPMGSTAVVDFTSFLDLADFSVPFSTLDGLSAAAEYPPGHEGLVAESMDTRPDGLSDPLQTSSAAGPTTTTITTPHHQRQAQLLRAQQLQLQTSSWSALGHLRHSTDALLDLNLQAQLFQQQLQQQQQRLQGQQAYQRPCIIPPTPNSIEMRGGNARFGRQMDAQAQALRYQRFTDDQVRLPPLGVARADLIDPFFLPPPGQMIFTPLVSPAVTPIETQFALPEYTVPGAYLSPLTSPALEAQHPASRRVGYHKASRSDTSLASSPVDGLDATPVSATSVTSQPGSAKRMRRPSVATRPPARVVRQSPSMKPQRRKAAANGLAPSKDRVDLLPDPPPPRPEGPRTARPPAAAAASTQTLPVPPRSRGTSESESISPEPLSEALMGPPPAPRSTTAGDSPPAVTAGPGDEVHATSELRPDGGDDPRVDLHPATPASLMRLPKPPSRARGSRNAPPATGGTEPVAETDDAPDATPSSASTALAAAAAVTVDLADRLAPEPTPLAKKTRTCHPIDTSTTGLTTGEQGSPAFKGATSPLGVVASGRKSESKGGGRVGTKRATSSSVHVSPALRPRISPSIKPLLPEGGKQSLTRLMSGGKKVTRRVADRLCSHLIGRDVGAFARIEIQLSEHPRRQSLARHLLPGSAVDEPDVEADVAQDCRTGTTESNQSGAAGDCQSPARQRGPRWRGKRRRRRAGRATVEQQGQHGGDGD